MYLDTHFMFRPWTHSLIPTFMSKPSINCILLPTLVLSFTGDVPSLVFPTSQNKISRIKGNFLRRHWIGRYRHDVWGTNIYTVNRRLKHTYKTLQSHRLRYLNRCDLYKIESRSLWSIFLSIFMYSAGLYVVKSLRTTNPKFLVIF